MGRISLLERKTRESEKSIHEAEEIARGAQLEAANWKEQFENAQWTIEDLQESRNLLEQQKRAEAPVTLASLGDFNIPSPIKIAHENEIATSDVPTSSLEAANWKEQFENAQGTIEELQESRNLLEQQKRGLTSELATAKASSSQFKRDKELLECSMSEQLSKASEEVRELKALLAKKEEYAGELVQSLTQAQADLQTFSDEIRALKSSQASLEASLDSHLAEHQILKNDIAMW
uniref:Virulence factor-related M protein-like n=1 Tax=Nicotiana tabacum TaxID=4097 RepID=A0A1S3XU93_TOBAC|nr:PREDICTED: virulence factor-related M protein-like [Nicotiana tabacum]